MKIQKHTQKNSFEITRAIDDKNYSDLSENFKLVVDKIFKHKSKIFKYRARICPLINNNDIVISKIFEKQYINVKNENSSIFGCQKIDNFTNFLKLHNVSQETINIVLQFIFHDGTTVGNGKIKYSLQELLDLMEIKIKSANFELNHNKKLLADFTDLCLFKSKSFFKRNINYIYGGNKYYGVICSRNQIINYVVKNTMSKIKTLHIGPFILKPYFNKKDFISSKCENVGFKWVNFMEAIKYINFHY